MAFGWLAGWLACGAERQIEQNTLRRSSTRMQKKNGQLTDCCHHWNESIATGSMDREGAREIEGEGQLGDRTRPKAMTREARHHTGTAERRREGGKEGRKEGRKEGGVKE